MNKDISRILVALAFMDDAPHIRGVPLPMAVGALLLLYMGVLFSPMSGKILLRGETLSASYAGEVRVLATIRFRIGPAVLLVLAQGCWMVATVEVAITAIASLFHGDFFLGDLRICYTRALRRGLTLGHKNREQPQ